MVEQVFGKQRFVQMNGSLAKSSFSIKLCGEIPYISKRDVPRIQLQIFVFVQNRGKCLSLVKKTAFNDLLSLKYFIFYFF